MDRDPLICPTCGSSLTDFTDADNLRRWQLIEKSVDASLDATEAAELADLQRRSLIAVEGL